MAELDSSISKRHRRFKLVYSKILIYFVLIAGSGLMIAPFIWMISTSLKDEGAVFTFPPEFIPRSQIRITHNGEEHELYKTVINGKEELVVKNRLFKTNAYVRLYKEGVVDEAVAVDGAGYLTDNAPVYVQENK